MIVYYYVASSGTTKLTQDYAKDLQARLRIKIISNKETHVKSPDISPMDSSASDIWKENFFSVDLKFFVECGKFYEIKEEFGKVDQVKKGYRNKVYAEIQYTNSQPNPWKETYRRF